MWCINTDPAPALGYEIESLAANSADWIHQEVTLAGPLQFKIGEGYHCTVPANPDPHLLRLRVKTEVVGPWSDWSSYLLVNPVPEPQVAGLIWCVVVLAVLARWRRA